MSFYAKFWGVRGSIPTPGHRTRVYGGNTSCVEFRINDQLFICDAGTGLRELGDSLRWREHVASEFHMFFSHSHWDHIQGFPFFEAAYSKGKTINVYGVQSAEHKTHSLLSGQMSNDYFPVDFSELSADIVSKPLDPAGQLVQGVNVSVLKQPHPGGSNAFKFASDGLVGIYATDCEIDLFLNQGKFGPEERAKENPSALRILPDDYVAFFKNADLLIHDAQYTDQEYVDKVGWGHPRFSTTVDLAVQAGVKSLALFHHDPGHSDAEIDGIVEQARARAKMHGANIEIFAARESLEVRLIDEEYQPPGA